MAVYFIGGSPCSGKSTIAAALAAKHDLYDFKVDDHLDRYLTMGAADKKENCLRAKQMTPEQIWMRDPQAQCEEELSIYEEIFEYILADIQRIDCRKAILAEGAALLPELAKRLPLPNNRYIAMTPTKTFQVFHYSQREWVPHILKGCSDQKKAFENWMDRDALFAKAVQAQCKECGYVSLINNASLSVEQLIGCVRAHFELS